MSNNNLTRKEKYRQLREVGFSSNFANKWKSRKQKDIDKLVEIRKHYNALIKEVLIDGKED